MFLKIVFSHLHTRLTLAKLFQFEDIAEAEDTAGDELLTCTWHCGFMSNVCEAVGVFEDLLAFPERLVVAYLVFPSPGIGTH